MGCNKLIKGIRTPSGTVKFLANLGPEVSGGVVEVPCGRCRGCRLERSRQWAIRIMHESSMHEANSFVTLTYDNKHLPEDLSIDVRHWQNFIRSLRRELKTLAKKRGLDPVPIRYFHCGEYGDRLLRPHYHACLFGIDFIEDRYPWTESSGTTLYRSDTLEKHWKKGQCLIGTLTFESAAYVARYLMKKLTGPRALPHYEWINTHTGEYHVVRPEYCTMSLKPGIGALWLQKFKKEVYDWDNVIINGKPVRPPKYYDRKFEQEHPEEFEVIRLEREKQSLEHPVSKQTLENREEILRLNERKRNYEGTNVNHKSLLDQRPNSTTLSQPVLRKK